MIEQTVDVYDFQRCGAMMAGMGFLSSFVVAPYDGVLFEHTETFMSTLASWRPYSVDEQSMKLVIKIVSAAVLR